MCNTTSSSISIKNVIYINGHEVAIVTLERKLIFFEGISEQIRNDVKLELSRAGIPFEE